MKRDLKNVFVKSKVYNNYIFMEVRNKGEKPFMLFIIENDNTVRKNAYFYVYNFDTDKMFIYRWKTTTFSSAIKNLKNYVVYNEEKLKRIYYGRSPDTIWCNFGLFTEANDEIKNKFLMMYRSLLRKNKDKRKYKEILLNIIFNIFPDVFNFKVEDTSFKEVKNIKTDDYVKFVVQRIINNVDISFSIFDNKITLTFCKTSSFANTLDTNSIYTIKILSNKEIKFGNSTIKVKDKNLVKFLTFINNLKFKSFARILKILYQNINYLSKSLELVKIITVDAREIFANNEKVKNLYLSYEEIEILTSALFKAGSERVIEKIEKISLALKGEAIRKYRNKLEKFLKDYKQIDIIGFLDAEKFQEYYLPNIEKCYIVDDSNCDFEVEEDYDFLNF